MKYLLPLSPLVLLHAAPVQAEVERTPAPSNLEQVAPLERPTVTRMIEPRMQEQSIAPAQVEQEGTDTPRIHGKPLDTAVKFIKPAEATSPPAAKAKAAEGTQPASPPSATTTKPKVSAPTPKAAAPSPQPGDKPVASAAGAAPAKPASAPDGASLAELQARGDDRLKKYDQAMNAIAAASKEERHEDALRMMKEIWDEAVRLEDFGTMGAMAYTAMRLNDEKTAIMAARKAAELVEDDEFNEILGNVLLRFDKLDEVEKLLKTMEPKSPERKRINASYSVRKAKVVFDQGNYAEAERLLVENRATLPASGIELLAWTQYRLGKLEVAAQAFGEVYDKNPGPSNAQGYAFAMHRLNKHDELLAKAEAKPGPLKEMLSPDVQAAIKLGGQRFSIGPDGRIGVANTAPSSESEKPGVTVRVEPKFRDKIGDPGKGIFHQHGALASVAWQGEKDRVSLDVEHQKGDNEEQSFSGQRYYLSWMHRLEEDGYVIRMGAGKTYTGGVVEPTWLGHIGLARYTPDWGLDARLFRRSNEETMLALVGTLDPLQRAWGRVVESGLALSGGTHFDDWKIMGYVTRSQLEGYNVAKNDKAELYINALTPLAAVPGLKVGPEFKVDYFGKTLSEFDYGHGGYFSPKLYIRVGPMFTYETKLGDLDLRADGGYSRRWNWNHAAPGNPLTGEEPDKYPASSGTGHVWLGTIAGDYSLAPDWKIGFKLGGMTAPEYTDYYGSVYLQTHIQ